MRHEPTDGRRPVALPELLQLRDVIDSMATLTMDLSVFGSLLLGVESFCVDASVRISVMIPSFGELTVQNLIYLCIRSPEEIHHHVRFKGFRRLPNIKENNTTCSQYSTHSIMVEFIDIYQVIIMNEGHVTAKCPLYISRQDQAHYVVTSCNACSIALTSAI
jgi:hypothetical protein